MLGLGTRPKTPVLWTPGHERSLVSLWLDASDSSTITESGGSVSQWDDKSGNGNHITQGNVFLQPTVNGNQIDFVNLILIL